MSDKTIKENIKSSKKIYVLDNGLLQIASSNSKNLGNRLENMVFNILNQSCDALTYMKDGKEIDLRCEDKLYQVSYEMCNVKRRKRELKAFKYLDPESKSKHSIVTYDDNGTENGIEMVSLENFIF